MDQKARSKKLRKALIKEVERVRSSSVAVPLSSGVDSHCALFACLDAGVNPHVYSFHLEGVESRDVRVAEETANTFGLRFTRVTLPSDIETLKSDVVKLAKFGCVSKTDFECFWPMKYLLPAIKEKALFTGHGADSLYCLSRKASQHFAGREDEFRTDAFSSDASFQKRLIDKWCRKHNRIYCPIFFNRTVLALFQGTSPSDINKPVQKAISRFAFPEYFEDVRIYNHQPFQLGDSGIRDHFENLLTTDLNVGGYKSVKGIYNELVRNYGG